MQVQQQVKGLIEQFIADIEVALRDSIVEQVTTSLGGKKVSAPTAAAKSTVKPKVTAKPTGGGAKRDPKVLAKLVEDLAAHIKNNPGGSIEEIGRSMSVATAELALPVTKLLAAKRITKKGQKRATRYYPSTAKKK